MTKPLDMTGKRFGRLIVIELAGHKVSLKKRHVLWRCRCDCGNVIETRGDCLRRIVTQSCGCLGEENRLRKMTTHGMSRTRLYHTWVAMIERCENPANVNYSNYGARGITVCPRWRESFIAFFEDMGAAYQRGLSLERRNNSKGYGPDNCMWATRAIQANNKRTNVFIELRGQRLTVAQWSRITGIQYSALSKRLKSGWSAERVLTQKVRRWPSQMHP